MLIPGYFGLQAVGQLVGFATASGYCGFQRCTREFRVAFTLRFPRYVGFGSLFGWESVEILDYFPTLDLPFYVWWSQRRHHHCGSGFA